MPLRPVGSTLSVHRAFVVHLGTGGGPVRRRFSGRVEHLSSGRTAHFSSLDRLLAFFAATLDEAEPAGPGGRPDHPGTTSPTGQLAVGPATDTPRGTPAPSRRQRGVYHRRSAPLNRAGGIGPSALDRQ